MGRQAGYTSPATRIRSLKRAIKYFKYKGMVNKRMFPDLAHDLCAQVDIPPSLSPILSISILPSLSISPNPPEHPPPVERAPHSVSKPSSKSSQPTYLTLDLARKQLSTLSKPQPDPDLITRWDSLAAFCDQLGMDFIKKEDRTILIEVHEDPPKFTFH